MRILNSRTGLAPVFSAAVKYLHDPRQRRQRQLSWTVICALVFYCLFEDCPLVAESNKVHPLTPNRVTQLPSSLDQPVININSASIDELRTLPGVGSVTAKRILAYRSKNPPFRRIEELLVIRGISRNRLEQMRERICAK